MLFVQRELFANIRNRFLDFLSGTFEIPGGQRHTVGNTPHFLCAQATGGDRSGTNTHTAGDRRLLGLPRNRLLLQSNVIFVQTVL